jgi:hypothetical protein
MSSELSKQTNKNKNRKLNQRSYLPRSYVDAITVRKEDWYSNKKLFKDRDRTKTKNAKTKFKPHFGLEVIPNILDEFRSLTKFASVHVPDSVFRRVEGLVALILNLQMCVTYQHFSTSVFLYLRDFYETSVTKQIMSYVDEVIRNESFDKQSNATPQWISALKDLQNNWTMVRNNKAFRQVSKLLGVLVTLGLCDASDLKFDIAGFKLMDENLVNKHMSAYDLADALFGTVAFFAEGAYLCFKTGSIQPLLLNDFAILELDEEYANIISWWDLVKCGNLERLCQISDSEFSRRLDTLIVKLTSLTATLGGLDKKIVLDKLMKCKIMKNELITLKISSGVRRSPFAIELYGESSQGKTTFGDTLLDALLTSAGLPIDKEYRAALNPGDKFYSNWTSDKLVAILDDMGNEKSQFVEKPPTRAIIDICNNQMYYAPKAELEAKGKCFVEPEVVLVTTNVKALDAGAYSNCPYSVQRRMDLVMTVSCKKEFQRMSNGKPCGVDSNLVRLAYTKDGVYTPPLVDDIWEITVERAVQPEKLDSVAKYDPVVWNNKVMCKVSATEAIQCAIEHFERHRNNQMHMMENMKSRTKTMTKCTTDGCNHVAGLCPYHPVYEKQFGLSTAVALNKVCHQVKTKLVGDIDVFGNKLERSVTEALYRKTNAFLEKWDWICVIPEQYLENEQFVEFLMWYYRDELNNTRNNYKYTMFLFFLPLAFISLKLTLLLLIFYLLFGFFTAKSITKKMLIEELKSRNDSLPSVIKNARDKYAKALCYTSAGIAGLYVLHRVYKAWKKVKPTQSALEPKSPEDVATRDEQANVWATVYKRSLPTSDKCKTMTLEMLMNNVRKNLFYASVYTESETLMVNVFMLSSNLMLIPNHYFEKGDTLKLTCYKDNCRSIGGTFDTVLSLKSSIMIPDTDFRLCYTPNGGSFKNLIEFLPTGDIHDHGFQMLWRKKDGTMIEAVGLAKATMTSNGTTIFKGGEYRNLSINTFGGLCGAVLCSQTKAPCITGFHLGGQSGTPHGCFGTLTKGEIEIAVIKLKALEGVIISGSGEHFTPQMFGKHMVEEGELHPKSPLNYLPEKSQFEYYGRCPGATTSRSDVRRTPISEHITDVCGVENIWGPPKMKPEWFGWQTALANASHPGQAVPHDLLEKSVKDYKAPLLELAKLDMWQTQPLSDHDNLCGIPGCKFIDSINLNTSMGYPLTGPKRKFVTELEPEPGKPNNRVFDDIVMDEIRRVEDLYRKGERAYLIAKACKKDEVLPVAKGKCRIFYGNSIVLTFLVRKYYLPILRFLQMNPLTSECAVGINCHGPEWDEFYAHATYFGKDRVFGGDYGKYDQKIPAQLLFASLRILIDLAREMGYCEEDCLVMEAMTGDLVYSLIAVNGDLIGIQSGTHISGNSLTVIINGICGSLNLRNFFYSKYDDSIEFRSAAHMMTYGDDNIGTVHEDYPEFNIKGMSEFLASYGQIYTMPDKESELVPYLSIDDFEFLKRFSKYHAALDCEVGALLDKSIFKSLHCYMRPKGCPLTPNEACALNIDTALREWFNHGEEVYETRRAQMREVAERAEISHLCTLLDDTYSDRVIDWLHKYRDAPDGEEVEELKFEPQSGSEVDLYEKAILDIPFNLAARDVILLATEIAEVDLVFRRNIDSVQHFVFVEIKHSYNPTCRNKGRKQLTRLVRGITLINPNLLSAGILLTYAGYELVIYTGEVDSWLSAGLPVTFT